MKLLLLSNSTAPGAGFLAHVLGPIGELVGRGAQLAFVAYASTDRDPYTELMRASLRPLGVEITAIHEAPDPRAALAAADAVFVGGGNSFRLLDALHAFELLVPLRRHVEQGMPYLGASAGAILACPTIRTTNDMPIVEPRSLRALGLVPFQINPHYPPDGTTQVGETRDERLGEFLEENDVPVLALREGAWIRVVDGAVALGGPTGGRVFRPGSAPREVVEGDDLSELIRVTTAPSTDAILSDDPQPWP